MFRSRMPDNEQIGSVLEYAIAHSPVDLQKLSPEGRVLIDDFRDTLETLRMIVHEKNADELFQNAVWSSYHGDVSKAKQDGVIPVSNEQAKQDGKTGEWAVFAHLSTNFINFYFAAASHIRVLIALFLTNSEARKLLKDFGIVGRDIFATAATKAADKARPSQEQLDSVDQEAPSHEWIGADGKKLGPNETPDLQIKGPGGTQARYHPRDDPRDAQ